MDDTPLQQEYGHHLLEEVLAGRMTRRELLRRASVVGISTPLISALLAACKGGGGATPTGSPQAAQVRRGGTIRVAMVPPVSTLDPVTFYDAGAIAVAQQVAEYLAWVENDASLRPVLAEKWSPDSEAKSWTFTLRSGVTFNNQQPMTADDVVATFDRLTDPKSNSAALSNFQGILSKGGTKRVDSSTVRFNLERAFVDFPYLVASTNYNALILPAHYSGDFQRSHIGTGPFTLTNYVPKQSATFQKNPNYWQKGLPYLDGAQFTFFTENQPQVLALQGGNVDMMLSTPFQGSQALFSNPNINILTARSSQYREVAMRVDMDPFTDKRVRQAIALTLDRQKIISGLFNGKGDLGDDHIFAPIFPIAPTLPQRNQDYAMAQKLLTDAGHPDGIKATVTAEIYLEVVQYAELIQAMAKPAKIDLTLKQEDQSTYYGSGKNQPWLQVPMGITDWASRAIPSQFIIPSLTCKGIWNSAHWCDQEFDKLSFQLDATLDEQSRKGIAQQMATIQQDETPEIIAYWIQAPRATTKKVQGVEANGSEFLDLTKAWLSA